MTETKKSSGLRRKPKQSLPFKRRNSYLAYPEDLYLETREGQPHYNPRVHRAFTEKTVQGILDHGVLEDVLVERCGDKAVVVDGRGRVINALEANRRLLAEGLPKVMVPVSPKRGGSDALLEIAVICNDHREQDDPVTEAYQIQRYMDMGRNEDDCAQLWGVTKKTIQNRLKLLALCPEARKAVAEGSLKVSRAVRLSSLSYEEQREAMTAKPKPRAKRPPKKKVQRLLNSNGHVPAAVRAAIQWINGEISDDQAAAKIKGFKRALGDS